MRCPLRPDWLIAPLNASVAYLAAPASPPSNHGVDDLQARPSMKTASFLFFLIQRSDASTTTIAGLCEVRLVVLLQRSGDGLGLSYLGQREAGRRSSPSGCEVMLASRSARPCCSPPG